MKHSFKIFGVLLLILCVTVVVLLSKKSNQPLSAPFSETPVADSTLSFDPNPLKLTNNTGKVDIILDTGKNSVRFVQLRLTYNPKHLSNVKISQGDFMQQATVLQTMVNQETGVITYMLEVPKAMKDVQGKGTIATITFTSLLEPTEHTTVRFAKETLVTNNNYSGSLVKKMVNGKIEKK